MEKAEILNKIETLFFEKSFKEVSMQDIASELGMKKASLYYHFPSKEIMLEEIIDYSFNNFLIFIQNLINRWNKNNFKELLIDFIKYPTKTKNLFSIINQNGYCDNESMIKNLESKQKIIFDTIHSEFNKQLGFNKEKTFLFMSLVHNIGKKQCIYGQCDIDENKLVNEIEKLFV